MNKSCYNVVHNLISSFKYIFGTTSKQWLGKLNPIFILSCLKSGVVKSNLYKIIACNSKQIHTLFRRYLKRFLYIHYILNKASHYCTSTLYITPLCSSKIITVIFDPLHFITNVVVLRC